MNEARTDFSGDRESPGAGTAAGAPGGHPAEAEAVAAARTAALGLAGALLEGLPVSVTVTDRMGIILSMNARARENFAKSGGGDLIGRNVLDCHPGEARRKLAELLRTAGTNTYLIEKAGARKLVHQCPWYRGGEYAGIVELSFAVPADIPVHLRGVKQ